MTTENPRGTTKETTRLEIGSTAAGSLLDGLVGAVEDNSAYQTSRKALQAGAENSAEEPPVVEFSLGGQAQETCKIERFPGLANRVVVTVSFGDVEMQSDIRVASAGRGPHIKPRIGYTEKLGGVTIVDHRDSHEAISSIHQLKQRIATSAPAPGH